MAFQFTIHNASIQDTLRYILNFVNTYSKDPFVVGFANDLNTSGSKEDFIKRLFNYICQHGQYQLDQDGQEEVWTPAKTISTRNAAGKFQYDCKKITILIGSVLKAAGIEPVLKHILYGDGKGGYQDYTHIYIIVPYPDMDHYLTVDPTNNCMWNTEVPHDKGTLYFLNGQSKPEKMDLHLIGNNNSNQSAFKNNASVMEMFGRSAGQVQDDMNAIMGSIGAGPALTAPEQAQLQHYILMIRQGIALSQQDAAMYHALSQKFAASQGETNLDFTTPSGSYNKEGGFYYTPLEAIEHTSMVQVFWSQRAALIALVYAGWDVARKTGLKINLAKRIANAWNHNPAEFKKFWWQYMGGSADARDLKTALVKTSGMTIAYSQSAMMRGNTQSIGMTGAEIAAIIAAAGTALGALATFVNKRQPDGTPSTDIPPPNAPPGVTPPGTTHPVTVTLPDGTNQVIDLPGPPPDTPPASGSMLDLSSPVNTIVKSLFLLSLSPMFSGFNSYFLSIGCSAAIIYSLIRSLQNG